MDRKRTPAPAPRTFSNTKTSIALFAGNGIAGEIDFDQTQATPIVDELTARQNVAEYTTFVNNQRADRQKTWSQYWERKVSLSRRTLDLEREAYAEGVQQYAKQELNGDTSSLTTTLPIVEPSLGAFDQPRPEAFTIPDPPGI